MELNSFKLLNIQLTLVDIDEITDEQVMKKYQEKIKIYTDLLHRAKNTEEVEIGYKELQRLHIAYSDLATKEKRKRYYQDINNKKIDENAIDNTEVKGKTFNEEIRAFARKYKYNLTVVHNGKKIESRCKKIEEDKEL